MSVHGAAFRFPPKQQALFDRAKRLEWISIIFLVTIIAAIGLVMGSSEAMKAVWIEDLLSLVPPIAFLIGARFRGRDPTDEYPYGYRRAGLVAYLTGAVALLALSATDRTLQQLRPVAASRHEAEDERHHGDADVQIGIGVVVADEAQQVGVLAHVHQAENGDRAVDDAEHAK